MSPLEGVYVCAVIFVVSVLAAVALALVDNRKAKRPEDEDTREVPRHK